MDISDNVNSIVQGIVAQITAQVQQQAMTAIQQTINNVVASIDSTSMMSTLLGQKIDETLVRLPISTDKIESQLLAQVNTLTTSLAQTVQTQAVASAIESINAQINQIDFVQLCRATLISAIQQQTLQFPTASIPGSAIDQATINLSGNSIAGGIIKNFGSTGIDDKATGCQLSIFDEVTVVENNLVTKALTVKGTTTIEGDLNVTGNMPTSSPLFQNLVSASSHAVKSDQSLLQNFADGVITQLKATGIDLNKITVQGQDVIIGNAIGPFVTQSNLQKVGQLQELQVAGESLLSATLYTTNNRVGINTVEPSCALSIWDQEVEITVSKQTSNTAIIETPRNQALILSSNGQNNITLTPDGATTVNKINMGSMSFAVGSIPPSDNQPKGSIVFNSNPSLGGPLGWVSLGDARWANFGIID
jgi:hypothetical protein